METRYRGWVPTVTGRLSFSHFGDLKNTHSVRRSDTRKRYLVAYQRRKIGDALIPEFVQRIFRIQARAYFVCVAQTIDVKTGNDVDAQGALVGKIFIITDRNSWKRILAQAIDGCFLLLADFDQHAGTPIEAHFSKSYAALCEQCEAQCDFQSDFDLKRNGVVDFVVNDQMRTREGAPNYNATPRLLFGLAHQTYSFLKDLGHHHKHHSARNDTITDLHNEVVGDDRLWRRRTLYGIYRRIITSMRREDIAQQISSIGLLAYAQTFKKIWLETYENDEREKKIPIFYDEQMQDSIRASELRMRFSMQQRTEQNSTFRTVLFSGVGLILSVAGLIKLSDKFELPIDPAPILISIATYLLKYPLQIFMPIFAVCYFWLVVWPRYLKPHKWRLFLILQAMLQPLRKKWALMLYWSLGLVMLILGGIILWGTSWIFVLWTLLYNAVQFGK